MPAQKPDARGLPDLAEPSQPADVQSSVQPGAMSDEDLLAQHVAGQVGAIDVLIDRYVGEIHAFLARFVGNATVADDLAQETFLQVHLAGAAFDRQRSFKPWLYTIAANKARDWLRARSRRQETSLDAAPASGVTVSIGSALADDGIGADEFLSEQEQIAAVRSVVAEMPTNLREILVLSYFQHLPYADIAAVLGIPLGTVKSRLHAAVGQFAKRWHERTGQPLPAGSQPEASS